MGDLYGSLFIFYLVINGLNKVSPNELGQNRKKGDRTHKKKLIKTKNLRFIPKSKHLHTFFKLRLIRIEHPTNKFGGGSPMTLTIERPRDFLIGFSLTYKLHIHIK